MEALDAAREYLPAWMWWAPWLLWVPLGLVSAFALTWLGAAITPPAILALTLAALLLGVKTFTRYRRTPATA